MKAYAQKTLVCTINNKRISFACYSRNTSSGFAHEAIYTVTSLDTGACYTAGKETAFYYNRTWECYSYQSVCQQVTHNQIHAIADAARARWMDAHGYMRMTSNRRAEWEKTPIDSDELLFWQGVLFWLNCIIPYSTVLRRECGTREQHVLDTCERIEHTRERGHSIYRIISSDGEHMCTFDETASRFIG